MRSANDWTSADAAVRRAGIVGFRTGLDPGNTGQSGLRGEGMWPQYGAVLEPAIPGIDTDLRAAPVPPAPGNAAAAPSVPLQERPVQESMAMADQPPKRNGGQQKPAHKPPPGMSLDEQIKAKNYPQDVETALRREVADQGTQERIERGELSLPSVSDAQSWYDTLPGD